MKRRFGRLYKPDNRDMRFSLPTVRSERQRKHWREGPWLGDQGSTPHCVGYATAHWLHCEPMRQYLDPTGIYSMSQYLDEWDGQDYDGTSVRGAVKLLRHLGFISEYRWAWELKPLIETVLEVGPVIVGTNWYAKMNRPDKDGVIKVGGSMEGGHAYLISGVDRKTGLFRLKNSWGRDWGEDGRAFISFDDMSRLLEEDGECCLGVEAEPRWD